MVYHESNFRKQIPCQRQFDKITGKCIYYDTCYGIHKSIENDKPIYYDKYIKLKEQAKKISKDYKDLEKENESLKNKLIKIKKTLSCKICKKCPKEPIYILLIKCDHIMCRSCFESSVKKNKKKCLLCGKDIEPKSVIQFSLDNDLHKNVSDDKDKQKKNLQSEKQQSKKSDDNNDDQDNSEDEEKDEEKYEGNSENDSC